MAFSSLIELPPRDSDGTFRVVVESPKGSTVKLTYEEQLGTFMVSRALPLGVSYPYDWGFIPGTRAADGDPVDALVIHDASTYPGVVLSCRLLGLVVVTDKGKDGRRVENNRVIAAPNWNGPFEFDRARDPSATSARRVGAVLSQHDLLYGEESRNSRMERTHSGGSVRPQTDHRGNLINRHTLLNVLKARKDNRRRHSVSRSAPDRFADWPPTDCRRYVTGLGALVRELRHVMPTKKPPSAFAWRSSSGKSARRVRSVARQLAGSIMRGSAGFNGIGGAPAAKRAAP